MRTEPIISVSEYLIFKDSQNNLTFVLIKSKHKATKVIIMKNNRKNNSKSLKKQDNFLECFS